jgi:hypothetical protein
MPRRKPRTRRRRAELPRPAHWPPLEREQHGGGTVEEGRQLTAGGIATMRGRRAIAECMLDYYRNAGHITGRQYDAGMRVRTLADRANLDSPVTASYNERVPGSGEMSDGQVRAREALSRIILLWNARQALISLAVCVYDEPAGARGLETLRASLEALAGFLRLPA